MRESRVFVAVGLIVEDKEDSVCAIQVDIKQLRAPFNFEGHAS
jgi:hypothetical protein